MRRKKRDKTLYFVGNRTVWEKTGDEGPLRGPRDHVIILDGTMSTLDPGCETHAGLFYKLLCEANGDYSVYYEPGLQWTDWRATWSVATGKGLGQQIQKAYGYLASRYREGDDIYLIGYSRGAYAVRSLAGMIDRIGLLRAEFASERNVTLAFRHYRHAPDSDAAKDFNRVFCYPRTRIEMVGVWDTVKALGVRLPFFWRYSAVKHAYHSHELGSSVANGFHALAYHETRKAYEPVLWDVSNNVGGHVEQVWFPGSHADVGGQLSGRDEVRPLSNLSFVWMLSKAEDCGLNFPDDWRSRFPVDPTAPSSGDWSGWSKLFWMRGKRKVLQDASERLHPAIEATPARRTFRSLIGALLPNKP